jgi:hypothetical protein
MSYICNCKSLVGVIILGVVHLLVPVSGWSDAIIRTQAMQAGAIAQYFVDESGIRLELEIGLTELESFQNLLPDELYTEMTGEVRPLAERLVELLENDLYVIADEKPLGGQLQMIEPRERIRRDPISGEPLPLGEGEEPELVIFAQIIFPFETPPAALTFGKRVPANLGFVLYHSGVAVNDFRYLGAGQRVVFDWEDPWYTSFESRTLRRTYYAPMSGFLYIEPYEVRKEIIIRPKDLQHWVDLGLEGRKTIPVEMQAELKRRVGEFLREHQPVTIDGQAVEPELARINFLERTLTASRVIDPPEDLDINSATLGAIFVYPTVEPLPQAVDMLWDLFTAKIPAVPVASVDQAGALPTLLEPDYARLEWQNFLRFPELPTLKAVLAPPTLLEKAAGYLSWVFLALALLLGWRAWSARRGQANAGRSAGLAVSLLTIAGISFWMAPVGLSQDYARDVVGNLLHNVYRAFDFRAEADVYDVLTQSVSGDLLTDIYLETRRGLVLENQGGARAKVKEIELVDLDARDGEDGGMLASVTWEVGGSVGHWGHLHERRNRYQAELDVRPVDGQWKLVSMEVLEEERL